jgi:DNA-binding response OmpR family regulator
MKNKTLLIVEDDRFIGEMYVRSLQKAGYSVDWVIDGNDALATIKGKPYEIILLDIMLPGVRGTEIINVLRSEESANPNAKVIVLTNFDQDEASRESIEDKVEEYLIKANITPRKLVEVIDNIAKQLD